MSWTVIENPICDLCNKTAVFRHEQGGFRCSTCPRPEPESPPAALSGAPSDVLTAHERDLMEHACGLNYRNKEPFYRNYYAADARGSDAAVWDSLVQRGFAVAGGISLSDERDSLRYYHVTEKGKQLLLPLRIVPKLTKPQLTLLEKAANKNGIYAVESYAPVGKLRALGLIETLGKGDCRWRATEGGCAVLGTRPDWTTTDW